MTDVEASVPVQAKDRAASRKAAKDLSVTRKRQKVGGDVIMDAKALWEKGRLAVSENKKPEKNRIVAELLALVKGQLNDLIFKHDASRIVQFLIKEGVEGTIRKDVLAELTPCLLDLFSSKYGRFVLTKFLKYVSESRNIIRDALLKSPHAVKKAVLNREASEILEEVFTQYSNTAQKMAILSNFYGPEYQIFAKDDKLPQSIIKNVLEHCQTSINRGTFGYSSVIHMALCEIIKTYQLSPNCEKQMTELVELLKEQFIHILHLKYGSTLVMSLLPYCSIKIKKAFVKECKPALEKIVTDDNGHLVLLALMDLTDDTVLLGKHIASELLSEKLMTPCFPTSNGKKVILFMLSAGFPPKYFNATRVASFDELRKTSTALGNTKKDRATKAKELMEVIEQPLYAFLAKEIVRNDESLLTLLSDTLASNLIFESLMLKDSQDCIFATPLFKQLFAVIGNDVTILQEDKHLSLFIVRTCTKSPHSAVVNAQVFSLMTPEITSSLLCSSPSNEQFGFKVFAYICKDADVAAVKSLITMDNSSKKAVLKQLKTLKEKVTLQKSEFQWIAYLETLLK